MERFKRRLGTLQRFENARAKKDHCPSSGEHTPLEGTCGDKACYPPSAPSPSREDEMLTEESSSHSGSDADYKPPSSPSSSEDKVLAKKSQSSCHSSPEKHQSHLSSIETEIGESKDQKAKGKSVQIDTESKEKRMFRDGKKRLQITVKTSKKKDGARVWDKAHYCVYCKKAQLKIARHLERKHGDECDVAYAFSFPVGSKQRKIRLEGLRNKGDWQHNLSVLEEGYGEIVTWKQPSAKVDIEKYLPCQHCYAMFKRTELWRHEKSCRERKKERHKGKRARVQKSSSHLIPIRESCNGVQTIIHSMLQDHVTSHIRSDEMICAYGDALFAKKGREESQHRYIAQKLRELGRFVLAAKEIDKHVQSLKDICDPANFQLAIKAARHVSNYDASKNEYGKPSTAVKIGFSLKGATEAWIGHCLMRSDVKTEKKAKKFKELLENSWSTYVSTNAHSTIEQRRWDKEDNVPLTEDVVTLQNYLRKAEDEAKAELREHVSTTAYRKLSESLLAQIIVFNKKREGEASRLTLETYLKADTGPVNKDIYETLSPVEKQLSHRLTRLVTRGKRGRKVPILLLERTKASLDFLIEKRTEVGILEENPFLFARLGTTTNLRGCDCLRRYAEESKAKNPELLRSTKLRKHVATLCQLLDLNNQELEQVARFMGHDIRVHCEYYRQTDKTFQVAKIGKLLFAMERGAESLKGKSLQTLDSVISGEGHTATPTKGLKGVKKRRTSDTGRQREAHDDGEQLITTSSSAQRQKKTVTRRRHDEDDDGSDGEVPHSAAARSLVKRQWQTARRHGEDDGGADEDDGSDNTSQVGELQEDTNRGTQKMTTAKEKHDDSDDDDDVSDGKTGPGTENTDGQKPHSTSGSSAVDKPKRIATTRQADGDDEDSCDPEHDGKGRVKRPKKTVHKRKRQDDEDWDGEDRQTTATRSPRKDRKKTAVTRERSDVDAPEMEVKKQGKRPWNDQERTAVKRHLGKFIALKKVPAKQDCLMCIDKESSVLRARTWKDVKYFVYNEIVKIKRKLAF
ncbi:uncharacterized protein LOC129349540 [Amphiprion ocellaris]|uniref:uncharacterized protein LOC129349540 n=1 Tax=Amphiprion ocellaris TaxID=80972 RepID=UPI0024113D5A|nr:uncharacterized protein LOC129349540 [Amphiprion ocellaris]